MPAPPRSSPPSRPPPGTGPPLPARSGSRPGRRAPGSPRPPGRRSSRPRRAGPARSMIRPRSRSRSSSALRSRCTAARASSCARRDGLEGEEARVLQRDGGLVGEVLQPPDLVGAERAAGDVADREHAGHPARRWSAAPRAPSRARTARPARASPAFERPRAGRPGRRASRPGAPSRTARPATASSPGMPVPGENGPPAAGGRPPPRGAPRARSSSHRTDTVPPSRARIPSAMCRPTLAASSDCTRACPTAESAAASRRAACSRAITIGLIALDRSAAR